MSAYIVVYQAPDEEHLPRLVTLAEDWLDQTTSQGVCIRNVAMVPRSRQLYLYVEAPTSALGAQALEADGLAPVSIDAADGLAWGRLVGRAAARSPLSEAHGAAGAPLFAALLAL